MAVWTPMKDPGEGPGDLCIQFCPSLLGDLSLSLGLVLLICEMKELG